MYLNFGILPKIPTFNSSILFSFRFTRLSAWNGVWLVNPSRDVILFSRKFEHSKVGASQPTDGASISWLQATYRLLSRTKPSK